MRKGMVESGKSLRYEGADKMLDGVYYCPKCDGLMIVVKALFMRGIYRGFCFNCGFSGYFREFAVATWRKR